MKKLPVTLSILALSSVTLAACTGDVPTIPEPETQVSGQEAPDLDAAQVEEVIAEVEKTVQAGDEALDADLLADRVKAPATTLRAAMYKLAEVRSETIPEFNLDEASATVTQSNTWPRAIIAPTTPNEDELPEIGFITQETARDSYKLHAWVRMFPGQELQTVAVSNGSPVVEADAEGFVLSPSAALTEWSARLDGNSESADLFEEDEFTSYYQSQRDSLTEALGENGKVTFAATLAEKPVTAVKLVDGSALVAGHITYTVTYERLEENAKIKLGGNIAEIMDNPEVGDKPVEVTYVLAVALNVPPEGSSEKIKAIGAEYQIQTYRTVE